MKVSELISQLQECDPEFDVIYQDDSFERPVQSVDLNKITRTVEIW